MSTNLSKQKRVELLGKIEAIRTYLASTNEGEDTGRFLTYLSELERQVKGQKYGMVFERHTEHVEEKLGSHVPYLEEQKELRISRGKRSNYLIEGDNLASLTILQKTHREQIDLCIIDPPYNRGKNDFIYDDDYVDTNDAFRHSKWASFMYSRLVLARKLLKPEGYIFLNIDENELTTLKMLCDQVFQEQNFVGIYLWEKTSTPPALSKKVRKKLEYILCYAKSLDSSHQFSQGTIDGDDAPLLNTGNGVKTLVFPPGSVRFKIKDGIYKPKAGMKIQLEQSVEVKDGINITPLVASGEYKWIQETLNKEIQEGTYFLVKTGKFSIRYQRTGQLSHKTPQNLLNAGLGVGTNEDAQKELKALSLPQFDYPKPSSLYTFLIDMINRKNDITVLDFFAGSGTTGHAVMKKNKEDGGSRRFILCTNNQENLCRDITYERLKRVMELEGYEEGLSYFKVGYLSIKERMYYEYTQDLMEHLPELIALEHGTFRGETAKTYLASSQEDADAFFADGERKEGWELYLGPDVLLTAEQECQCLEQKIQVREVPDYYYRELEG